MTNHIQSMEYKYVDIWTSIYLAIVGDKQWVCCVEWRWGAINPCAAHPPYFRPTLKYIRTIAVCTIGTRVDLYYSQWNRCINEHVTKPSTYVYICEQNCVHKRSQRRMRIYLATVSIFRIFTVLDRVSKPVWSKSGVKESRKSIDNSLPINIYLKIHANIFGYTGYISYIYHVEARKHQR